MIDVIGFWIMPVASAGVSIALLIIEVRAFLRHKHASFLLLAAGTACVLLYVAGMYGVSYYVQVGNQSVPNAWLYAGVALQVGAIVFGFWGTASLIGAYDQAVRTRVGT